MFWGLSQIYDGGKTGKRMLEDLQAGNYSRMASDGANLIATGLTAEHSALNYRPRRLMAAVPEWGPFLQKSVQVKLAEQMQDQMERRRDRGIEKGQLRRDRVGTIEDRVRRMTEPQPQ
jgi:hypothetical protein